MRWTRFELEHFFKLNPLTGNLTVNFISNGKQKRACDELYLEQQVKLKDSRPSVPPPGPVASFSDGNPTKEYTSRKNSGHVVCNYGNHVDTLSWSTSEKYAPEVEFSEEFNPVNPKVRYMFSTILDKIQTYKKQGDDLCKDIIDNNDLKPPIETHHITMETATFAGRILCDGRGKLNPSSLLLECCLFNIREEKVKLEVNEAPEYSLFPGQVIVVEGKNPDGKRIIAEKIYADAKPDIYPDFDPSKNLQESLQVVIACGPFMLANGSYQPFLDLKKYVVKNLPHVLIIIGPLVDAQNPNILQFGNNMKFIDCFESLLKTLMDDLEGTHTKVVYTSSWRESNLHIVYPTPHPLHVSFKSKNLSNLKLVPDPSILDISGFTIGVTASDILLHLSPEELCHPNTPQNVPRLCRIASHLLKQKSFYPLKPSHDEMSIDARLSTEHAYIPLKPHVLVLPSNLKSFVNVADDCVIINPERVAKGEYGGSFARLQVRKATDGEKWSPATHISAQVIKV
ncbi:DNA polymerase alpha subunit B isoform X2 [Planococcus citri]|uniref:DNA polymerase alpha subunit B isoform X2 n=1 Tax=Planococcus citri TaxID=170843 RepID=UPI0031F74834